MTKSLIRFLDRHFYQNFDDNWDNKIFRNEILKYINNQMVLLDIGAGPGITNEMNFKGLVQKVYGLDLDMRVLHNPFLDEAFVGSGTSMKMFKDGQFDLVICNSVLEHLEDPVTFFLEARRVLKDGGFFIIKTTNKHHYVPIIARITPLAFHKFINKIRGRNETETFPTFYRVNTKWKQTNIATQTGFESKEILCYEGRPEYLRINFLTYILGIFYERIVNLLHLDLFKIVIIGKFQKNVH